MALTELLAGVEERLQALVRQQAERIAALEQRIVESQDYGARHANEHADAGRDPYTQAAPVIGHLHSKIEDADGDTTVETERTADIDITRFKNGGTESAQLQAGGFGVAGWIRAGSLVVPANTTAGDITGIRMLLSGSDSSIPARRLYIAENYVPGLTGSLVVDTAVTTTPGAGISLTTGLQLDVAVVPTANANHTARAFSAGTNHSSGAFNITGALRTGQYQVTQGVAATTLATAVAASHEYYAAAGTITTAVAIDVIRGTGSDAGAIGTGIGLRIAASAGVTPTTDIAIQSLGGMHRLVGATLFGVDATPANNTAGDVSALRLFVGTDAALLSGLTAQVAGALGVSAQNALRLYDGDNSNFIAHRANSTRTTDLTYDWPVSDPAAGSVLTAAVPSGSVSVLSWVAATRTLVLTAAGGAPTTTSGCADTAKVEAGTNDVDYWTLDFDTTTQEYAFWNLVTPDNYDAGTLTARFVWTAASGSGGVRWGIAILSRSDDDAIDTAYGTAQEVSDTLLAAGDVHISAATSAITPGGTAAAGDQFFIRVYRLPSHADDTLAVDARLLQVKLEYTTNAYSD